MTKYNACCVIQTFCSINVAAAASAAARSAEQIAGVKPTAAAATEPSSI
jgi:hypothetical protein